MESQKKIALVTGAGRGIGKAIAIQLSSDGYHVICVSKSQTCKATAQSINDTHRSAEAQIVDVSNSNEVKNACDKILAQYGTVDVLINNAGITRDNLLLRMTDDEWDSVLRTNLSSCFYWTKNLLRAMTQKRCGRIVNISSIVGKIGNFGQANYAAAKAGIIGFSKSVAKEVASRGVTVNVIAPGFIESDMTATLSEKIVEEFKKNIPMKHMGSAEDIANAVSFLCSDAGNYITGEVLTVDGGMTM